ncbi:MAG: hypothetical protein ACJ72E_16185 [Marmoricola sp.]
MRRQKVRWLVGIVCVALCGGSTIALSSPAFAVSSEFYSVFKCVRLPGASTYVQVIASGTVTWTTEKIPVGQRFNNVTVKAPTITVASKSSCARTASSISRSKLEVTQGFYSDECSANAGISAGFPWGVSVAPTYSCGSERVGSRSTSYGKGTIWTQNNTGAPVVWKDHVFGGYYGSLYPWPCLDMRIAVTIYNGTSSDEVRWGDNESLKALEGCVDK